LATFSPYLSFFVFAPEHHRNFSSGDAPPNPSHHFSTTFFFPFKLAPRPRFYSQPCKYSFLRVPSPQPAQFPLALLLLGVTGTLRGRLPLNFFWQSIRCGEPTVPMLGFDRSSSPQFLSGLILPSVRPLYAANAVLSQKLDGCYPGMAILSKLLYSTSLPSFGSFFV